MSKNSLELELIINGKQATATLALSNENVMKLAESLRVARRSADDLVDRFESARNVIQGFREIADVVRSSFGGLINEYSQSVKAQARVEAVIKATGGAAGLTAERLKEMADSYAQLSVFTDDAILSAEATLLTFDKISGDTFPRVVAAGLDVASALNTDINSALQLLGRSLQFPDEGLTQLNRSLRLFNDQEEERIRLIVKSGQEDRARAEILERIESKFKGLAEADLKSPEGQMIQFGKSVDNLKESGGQLISGFLIPVVGGFTDVTNALNEAHPVIAGTIAIVASLTVSLAALRVTGLGGAITSSITSMIGTFKNLDQTIFNTILRVNGFMKAIGPIGWIAIALTTIVTLWGALSDNIDSASKANLTYQDSVRGTTVEELKLQKTQLQGYIAAEEFLKKRETRAFQIEMIEQRISTYRFKLNAIEEELLKKSKQQEVLYGAQGKEILNTLDAELQQTEIKRELVKLEQQRLKMLEESSKVGLKEEGRINELFNRRKSELERADSEKQTKQADAETARMISVGEKRLQAQGRTELEILDMKRVAIQTQIKDEKLKEEKLADIDAEIFAVRKSNAIKQRDLNSQIANDQSEIKKTNALIEVETKYGRESVSNAVRIRAAKLRIDDNYLREQKRLLEEQLAAEDSVNQESYAKRVELENRIAELNLQIVQNNKEAAEIVKTAWIDNLQAVGDTLEKTVGRMSQEFGRFSNSMYQLAQNDAKREVSRDKKRRTDQLNKEKEERLSHAFTQEQKQRINEEYEAKQQALDEEMRKKQAAAGKKWFELQKAASIAEGIVNTYTAATAALKTQPPPLGIALAALITAAGLANVAVISQQKPPAYVDGGLVAGGKQIIQINEEGQEYVVNAEATRRYLPFLEMINKGQTPSATFDITAMVNEQRLLRREIMRLAKTKPRIEVGVPRYTTKAIVSEGNNQLRRSVL